MTPWLRRSLEMDERGEKGGEAQSASSLDRSSLRMVRERLRSETRAYTKELSIFR